jgi:hypothetical protein
MSSPSFLVGDSTDNPSSSSQTGSGQKRPLEFKHKKTFWQGIY